MSLIDILSEKLQLSKKYISELEKNASEMYKVFKISKRNNTYRKIYHPAAELKTLQYWIKNYIFERLPVSEFSTAYGKGCSIKKNAIIHKESKHYLHIDLKNFFESITKQHIVNLLENNAPILAEKGISLSKRDIDFICNICLRYDRLTIGSVCSPVISNVVMYKIDLEVNQSIGNSILFSRYADDLVFSSQTYIPAELIENVRSICQKYSFEINDSKTKFMSKSGRRSVTGIIVDNNKISIGLYRRRYIKSLLYNKIVKGEGDSRKILGYLFFLKDIEPNYFNKIIVKYSYLGNVLEMLNADRVVGAIVKRSVSEAAATIEVPDKK